jgi:hypothetical protein
MHWLVEEKSGEHVWQQSKGALKILRQYVDVKKSHLYEPRELENFWVPAEHQRIKIISDKARTGKTTVLTQLSKRIKRNSSANWLVSIDLNDYTELLEAQKGMKMDKGKVFEFISKEVLKLEYNLEKELFKKNFDGNEISKLIVMVKEFDEISPNYKEIVIDMLQVLKQAFLDHLWVTTRPHLNEVLKDIQQQVSYTLQHFSEFEQVDFLKKFWLHNLKVKNQHRLKIYGKALIRKLAQSISDKDKEFTDIPLQTRMLAQAIEEECRIFYTSEQSDPVLQHTLDLEGLYRRFTEGKYDICYKEKAKIQPHNVGEGGIKERDSKNIQLEHQLLALKELFSEDQVTFLQSYNHSASSYDETAKIGIVQRNNEGKQQFIHRTFTEFCVAELLINYLITETEQLKKRRIL